jgi:pyruvate/2-oxoglutarate dehydrogenase complex dihydrolipoamide acyltransferase (E2) component
MAVRVPQVNVNDDCVRILSWLVACGAKVKKGDYVVEVETSKSTVEIEAPEGGYVHFTLEPGDEVAIGDVLCHISPESNMSGPVAPLSVGANGTADHGRGIDNHAPLLDATRPDLAGELSKSAPPVPPAPSPAIAPEGEVPLVTRISARARALLEARGLDPSLFEGKGLIRERDILRLVEAGCSRVAAEPRSRPDACQAQAVKPAEGVKVRRETLSRQKVMEAKVLAASYYGSLASSVTIACQTGGLRRLVQNDPSLRNNATALIVFETARLLRQYPLFNCYRDGEEVCYYEEVNVGFAVDAGQGLKVLVVHDAAIKPAAAIANEMRELVGQYLDNRLPMKALTGCTFTITDLSGEGVTSFAPLINQGQSAILGVGAERISPHSGQGEFSLTLTFDHQIAEGRTAARFLNALKERLRAHEAALTATSRRAPRMMETAGEDLFCGRCLRTAEQMRQLDGYLVQSAFPDGYVCSFCLGGF